MNLTDSGMSRDEATGKQISKFQNQTRTYVRRFAFSKRLLYWHYGEIFDRRSFS
jgi:hypothetical protein